MNLKKLIALVIAAAMMMTVVSAFAATATVTNNTTGHTYDVYQIFKGTQTGEDNDIKLGDIEWGNGINDTAFLAALKTDSRFGKDDANIFKNATTAQNVADALGKAATDDSEMAKAFANVAAANLGTKISSVEAGAITPALDPGYYLFVDTTNPLDEDDAMNSALLQITGKDLTIAEKYTTVKVDKDITKVNDTVVEVEAADVNIGDTVQYTITGTLPSNYADYETYFYKFTDTLSKGQSVAANGIKVYKNEVATENDVTDKFIISPTTAIDGTAETPITITNNNLKDPTSGIAGLTKDDKFIVEYTVTITEDAVIGSAGNKNEVKIEFSNNPNHTGSGTPPTGETPPDSTLVFTYDLNPTKVDGANSETKLKDAQFVLKATSGAHNGKYVLIDAQTKKVTGWTATKPTVLETAPTTGETGVLVSGSDGKFEAYGLDAGTYDLEEIKAPVGYNLLTAAVQIEIKATVVGDDNTNPALQSLTIKVDGQESSDQKTTGVLPATIVNNGGVELPTTGGIGTTLFYIIGGLMVLAAGIVLVSRKKAAE